MEERHRLEKKSGSEALEETRHFGRTILLKYALCDDPRSRITIVVGLAPMSGKARTSAPKKGLHGPSGKGQVATNTKRAYGFLDYSVPWEYFPKTGHITLILPDGKHSHTPTGKHSHRFINLDGYSEMESVCRLILPDGKQTPPDQLLTTVDR